jgi:predicted transposase YdaD
LGTKLEYKYNVYQISQQSEAELLKSNNPFAMVVLTVRSVLKNKTLDDNMLMEIKQKLARRFLTMLIPKEKITMIMNFLKSYIRFEDKEKNIIFERDLKQITGRKETMGLEELILDVERKRGEKRGIEVGEKRGIELGEKRGEKRGIEHGKKQIILNMIQKKLTDDTIADLANVPIETVQKIRASMN